MGRTLRRRVHLPGDGWSIELYGQQLLDGLSKVPDLIIQLLLNVVVVGHQALHQTEVIDHLQRVPIGLMAVNQVPQVGLGLLGIKSLLALFQIGGALLRQPNVPF